MKLTALLISTLLSGLDAATSAPPVDQDLRTRVSAELKQVHDHLWNELMPYWATRAPDAECGGFLTHLDEAGHPSGPTNKFLTMQARMIWTFAAAHRHGMVDRGYLEFAKQGFAFVTKHMADQEHGGYYASVSREGGMLKDHKSVYQQSFAIYAFSELYLASGEPRALECANNLFETIETKARDGDLGYHENLASDWSLKDPGKPERKTLDTHMHLLECFTTLYEASGDPRHREALERVLGLLLTKAIHPHDGFAFEPFDREWEPQIGRDRTMTTMYGHNVELAWLMMEACRVLKRDREEIRPAILGLINHAVAFGTDHARGGLALYGPQTGDVLEARHLSDQRFAKSWWEQAELLVATSEAFAWTGDAAYHQAFQATWDWVWKYQIDHVNGEWFLTTDWTTGAPIIAGKGGDYKCAYHNGRALMRVERCLSGWLAATDEKR